MDTNIQMPQQDTGVPFEDRFGALEHQCYLMYLQLNAVTQLIVEKGLVQKEEIGTIMDSMHGEIVNAVAKLETEDTPEDPAE